MKVYELIDKLAHAPAGAEVSVSKVMTLSEVAESTCESEDDEGAALYEVGGKVKSIFHENGDTVFLFL